MREVVVDAFTNHQRRKMSITCTPNAWPHGVAPARVQSQRRASANIAALRKVARALVNEAALVLNMLNNNGSGRSLRLSDR